METSKWDACTMDPHLWMRAIECHPSFAGYLQFIGTMLALIVAIGVPLLIDQLQRAHINRDRKLRAASMLRALTGDVGVVATRAILLAGPISSIATDGRKTNDWADALVLHIPPRLESVVFESNDVDRDVLKPIVDIVIAAAVYNGFLEAFRQARFDTSGGFEKMLFDLDKRRNKVVEHASVLARLYDANVPLERLGDEEARKILNL